MDTAETAPEVTSEQKKWTAEYQPADENGQPIGRPTKLGPFDTAEELIAAQQKAHIEATRAYFRVKNAKPDPRRVHSEFKPREGDDAERQRLRALLEAEIGAPVDEIRSVLQTATQADGKYEVSQFLAEHAGIDYYPCPQNKDAIGKYLQENSMAITANNLEIAREALTLAGQLLPAPATASAPNAPVNESEPPNPAPSAEPIAPAPKPPASGVMPGSFRGTPTPKKTPGLTKQDIAKMPPAEYRAALRNPTKRAEIERVLAA